MTGRRGWHCSDVGQDATSEALSVDNGRDSAEELVIYCIVLASIDIKKGFNGKTETVGTDRSGTTGHCSNYNMGATNPIAGRLKVDFRSIRAIFSSRKRKYFVDPISNLSPNQNVSNRKSRNLAAADSQNSTQLKKLGGIISE